MRAPTVERRSEPRLGVAMRVGLALTATGIASAGLGRRALAETGADVPLAAAFGCFAIVLFLATLQRPPRASAWIGLALVAGIYISAAVALAETPLGMLAYFGAAALATWRTAPHLRAFTVAAFALFTPALGLFATRGATVLPAPVLLAAMFALAYTVAALVDPSRVHPSDRLRRVGFGIAAIAVMAGLFDRHLAVGSTGVAPDDLLAILAAFALPLLAHLRVRPATRDLVATSLVLTTFTLVCLVCVSVVPYHADAVAAVHRMAEIFLSGQNPYAVFDLPEALARFPHMDPELATHLEGRAVLHSYNYPALSFLVVAPFVALGLGDIRWVYLGVLIVIAILVVSRLRMAWRPMALATIVGNAVVLRQPILAGIDPTWALLTIAAWLALGRAWLSPVLLGLAFAARQTAWFVAPFYVALVWQRSGGREAMRRALIAAAVAAIVNVPFFARAPERFIDGLSAPFLASLEPDGVGLVRFGLSGIGPLLPRVVYGILAFVAFAVLFAVFIRWRRTASAPLVWPFLPLYFAWRSLQNYFVLAPLFVFVADEELAPEVPPPIAH
jgi:uncharacterized membrane protein